MQALANAAFIFIFFNQSGYLFAMLLEEHKSFKFLNPKNEQNNHQKKCLPGCVYDVFICAGAEIRKIMGN